MMTSLIIIKIRFICFKKDEIDRSCIKSHAKSYAKLHNYKFYNHSVIIAFFFDVIFNK